MKSIADAKKALTRLCKERGFLVGDDYYEMVAEVESPFSPDEAYELMIEVTKAENIVDVQEDSLCETLIRGAVDVGHLACVKSVAPLVGVKDFELDAILLSLDDIPGEVKEKGLQACYEWCKKNGEC